MILQKDQISPGVHAYYMHSLCDKHHEVSSFVKMPPKHT